MYGSHSTTLALTFTLGATALGHPTAASAQTTVPTQTSTASADTTSDVGADGDA